MNASAPKSAMPAAISVVAIGRRRNGRRASWLVPAARAGFPNHARRGASLVHEGVDIASGAAEEKPADAVSERDAEGPIPFRSRTRRDCAEERGARVMRIGMKRSYRAPGSLGGRQLAAAPGRGRRDHHDCVLHHDPDERPMTISRHVEAACRGTVSASSAPSAAEGSVERIVTGG